MASADGTFMIATISKSIVQLCRNLEILDGKDRSDEQTFPNATVFQVNVSGFWVRNEAVSPVEESMFRERQKRQETRQTNVKALEMQRKIVHEEQEKQKRGDAREFDRLRAMEDSQLATMKNLPNDIKESWRKMQEAFEKVEPNNNEERERIAAIREYFLKKWEDSMALKTK